MRKELGFLILSLSLCFGWLQAADKEIVRLQSDVLQLQDQIRMLQKTLDEKNGMIISLLEQLNDQAARNTVAFEDLMSAVGGTRAQSVDTQKAVSALKDQLQVLTAKMDETNNRVAALHRKLEENQVQIQSLRTVQTDSSSEVEPDRVYSATFNDYLMGNYALAVSGFQDFLSNYPDSEYADNAAYYLGDSHLKQGNHELAVQALEQVINLYPKGDKTAVAYFKKAVALESLQRLEEAVEALQKLIQLFPEAPEARLAQDELAKLGVLDSQ